MDEESVSYLSSYWKLDLVSEFIVIQKQYIIKILLKHFWDEEGST